MTRWLSYTLSALALGCLTLVATPVNAAGRDEARASRGDRGRSTRGQNRANRPNRARENRRAEQARTQRARENRRAEQARTQRARENRRAEQARTQRARQANQARRAREARRNRAAHVQTRRARQARQHRRARHANYRHNHRRYRPVRWVNGRRGAYWVHSGRRHTYLPRRARRVHRHGGLYFFWDGLYFMLHDGAYVQVNFDDDPCCDDYGCGLCDDAPGEVEVWY
jgi:hypothetical protein